MPISLAPNRITHMDELSFPATPFPYPEDFEGNAPQVPFPPVEAYAEELPDNASYRAFLVVRESLDTHLLQLLEVVRAQKLPATPEDVRRLCQVRTVVLGALETLS